MTSAEKEFEVSRKLLDKGFSDAFKSIDRLINSHEFVVLGYKGSGKSAINEKLKLEAEKRPNLFVTSRYLQDFPYTDFASLAQDDTHTFPAVWSWLLLLHLFGSFSKDEGLLSGSAEAQDIISQLRRLNLMPNDELKEIVQKTAKIGVKFGNEKSFGISNENSSASKPLEIPFFIERLKQALCYFTSSSIHMLVIDGLDDVLTGTEVQLESLSALLLETERLNAYFKRNYVKAKIVLLCRTDLYEKLPAANKNKTRQDSAIDLNWYHSTLDGSRSPLINLANLRASLTEPRVTDVFRQYLPETIDGKRIEEFLLLHTRHTPRDMLRTLHYIQQACETSRIGYSQVMSGLASYSRDYFLPEIRDELSGYLKPDDVERMFRVLGGLSSVTFTMDELRNALSSEDYKLDQNFLYGLQIMYDSSALGHRWQNDLGVYRYAFKYRNRNTSFQTTKDLVLHRGLWKALNIV